MKPPIFVCLTNIPTPYRLFQFAQMHEELQRRGWKFEVWFMAGSEPGRDWTFGDSDFRFPHRFLRGSQLRLGKTPLYWNPAVFRMLRDTRPEILLVAGAWIHPTIWMAALSSAARRTIFWAESHLQSIQRGGLLMSFARRRVLRRFREFAVPGVLAKEYVQHYVPTARIFLLPNLVNPSVFCSDISTRRTFASKRSTDNDRKVLLIVARLSDEKGLVPFLEAMRLLNRVERSKLTVVIAGSGALQQEIEDWSKTHDIEVCLPGQQEQRQMAELYAQADGFCLPSIFDPNPLSVIEALWAGLPLILSSRVGNHPECLREGQNGFIFDPIDSKSAARAVSQWLALSRHELSALGRASLAIARERFDPDPVISSFLDDVLGNSCVASRSRLASAASTP